jgi:hypothetical protein
MKQDGIVRIDHFDDLVVRQILRMRTRDVDVALDQLKHKKREKMRTIKYLPAYLASFFRIAIGQ